MAELLIVDNGCSFLLVGCWNYCERVEGEGSGVVSFLISLDIISYVTGF